VRKLLGGAAEDRRPQRTPYAPQEARVLRAGCTHLRSAGCSAQRLSSAPPSGGLLVAVRHRRRTLRLNVSLFVGAHELWYTCVFFFGHQRGVPRVVRVSRMATVLDAVEKAAQVRAPSALPICSSCCAFSSSSEFTVAPCQRRYALRCPLIASPSPRGTTVVCAAGAWDAGARRAISSMAITVACHVCANLRCRSTIARPSWQGSARL